MRSLAMIAGTLCLAAGLLLLLGEAQPVRGAPSGAELVAQGQQLFARSCASCHGASGQGTSFGPSLTDAGAAAADFELSTGRMPLATGPDTQAKRKPPAFDDQGIQALVAYVASLGTGPPIPQVNMDQALLSRGQQLFIANCAPCHGATGNGGAVGAGVLAPALNVATPLQIAEAMAFGPGQMPHFAFGARDANAVVTYVDYLQHAGSPGGFSIGGIGPVPEGFVGWVLGMGLMLLIVVLVGRSWTAKGGDGDHVP